MKLKFEVPDASNPELVKKAVESFITSLSEYGEDITITSLNLYISARTFDGTSVCGFEDGDMWLVKPLDFKPRVPMDKFNNPKVICNKDGEPLVKVYENKSETFVRNNYIVSDGLCYQNR